MARILTEGFEMGDAVAWSTLTSAAVSSVLKRTGNYALRVGSTGTQGNAKYTFSSAMSEGYIRWGFLTSNFGNDAVVFRWLNGVTELGSLRYVAATQAWHLYVGTSSVANVVRPLSVNTPYLFELRINIADAGVLDFRIEGVSVLSYSGDTKPDANTAFDVIGWSWTGTAGGAQFQYIDDLAVNDTSGGADNSWCGDGKIIAVWPDGTDTHQLTGSDADTVDNHLLVDEKPSDDDTTYVQGNVVDERDLYTFAACEIVDADYTINRIWAEARAKDTVADGGTIALVTKASGGAEVEGGTIALLTSYTIRVISAEQLVNPVDSEPWQAADIDALIAGPKTKS
jgi:hypothetical protein